MKQVPMLNLKLEYEYMKRDIDSHVEKCFQHQNWILGPELKTLEQKIAEYLEVKHCIGVACGTDALLIALRTLAIKLNGREYFNTSDKIITTPFTFTATGDAILRAGATPVFVDIDPDTYNIDTSKIRECLSSNVPNNVVGILPVHLYGQSCNMDELRKIAKRYNLFIVEDSAQAFGARWQDKKVGSIGDAGAFSFFPSKNLGGFGDGGMIATNDGQIAEIARMLLKHGGKDKYNATHIGYNSRLDTIQAAILLAKLKYIDEFNDRRRRAAEVYTSTLSGISGLTCPKVFSDAYHIYHQYTIRVSASRRQEIQKVFTEEGICTSIYYPLPLHKMKAFKGRAIIAGRLEHTEKATQQVLNLPIGPLLCREEQSLVCKKLKEVC